MIRARIANALGLLSVVAAAHSDSLSWEPVTEDVEGTAIAHADIQYQTHWSLDDVVWSVSSGGTTQRISLPLDAVPPGCFYFRVTAIRTDSEFDIESDPSNTVYYCGAAGGTAAPASPIGVTVSE